MSYYLIVSLPFVLFFSRLLFTNLIVPHAKKRQLYRRVQQRTDWPSIQATEDNLYHLFRGNHGKLTSKLYRSLQFITNKEFIYGEIDFLSFHHIIEQVQPQPEDVFYDLGSGSGKAVFAVAWFFNVAKACGIELLPPLYRQAVCQITKAKDFFDSVPYDFVQQYINKMASISFVHANFLEYNFNDATIVYIAATCLTEQTWERLIQRLSQLQPGTRIIVATKTIQHRNFTMIYQGTEIMSWGLCPVKIYQIQQSTTIEYPYAETLR